MIEQQVDIATADGTAPTFVTYPDQHGPHPVVLFLMDAPGMREEIRNMCRRLASAGYFVMAPQLYYRDIREYTVYEDGDRDRMYGYMTNLSNGLVANDCQSLLEFASTNATADTDRVGVIGYCMSGPFALYFASVEPDRVKAAASIHGVKLVTGEDDSPHKQLASTKAEIYVGCAEIDDYAPPELIAEFDEAMQAAKVDGQIEWHPGTHHGFAFAEREGIYDQDASERHWERMHSLFRRNLL